MNSSQSEPDGGSQTLSRGLSVLEIIGESDVPLSVAALAEELGIHRSMVYRLIKTLEQHGFVRKSPSGGLVLGMRISSLARGVLQNLQEAAAPELAALAEELEMTAFLVSYDGESAVTLRSAEPLNAQTTVAKKPGTRHSIDRGAPGHVIRSQLDPVLHPAQRYESSQDEVLPGIAAIAVPLVIAGNPPSALAVIYLPRVVNTEQIAEALTAAAARIVVAVGG